MDKYYVIADGLTLGTAYATPMGAMSEYIRIFCEEGFSSLEVECWLYRDEKPVARQWLFTVD